MNKLVASNIYHDYNIDVKRKEFLNLQEQITIKYSRIWNINSIFYKQTSHNKR